MTKHQDINSASSEAKYAEILRRFWRRGRKQFVPLTINELAQSMKTDPSGLGNTVRPMLEKGLLSRQRIAMQHNISIYEVTPAGAAMVEGAA